MAGPGNRDQDIACCQKATYSRHVGVGWGMRAVECQRRTAKEESAGGEEKKEQKTNSRV
jgi:hypothetical protein